MSMDEARWSSGSALTFVWPGGTLMLGVDLEGERLEMTVEQIWGSLSGEVTLGGILQLLTDVLGASLLNLPDFAVALFDGPAGQFAARGRFQVEVGQAVGTVSVAGLGVTTWSERAIDGIRSVSLGEAGGTEELGLPLRAGVVRASKVAWGMPVNAEFVPLDIPTAPPSTAGVPSPAWEPEPTFDDLRPVTVGVATTPSDSEAIEGRAPVDPAALGADPAPLGDDPAWSDDPVQVDEGSPTMTSSGAAEPSGATTVVSSEGEDDLPDPPEPGEKVEDQPAPPHASRFAALWGDTSAYSIEEAAVRLEDVETPKAQRAATEPSAAPVAVTTLSNESDIISSVPGRGGSAAAAPAAPATQDWSDHDGATVVGFSIGTAVAEAAAEPTDSETVLALVCPSGHANRPHRETCRQCGAALSAGFTQTVPRPSLGQIRSSTGEIVPLSGPVLIGRSPRAARFQGTVSPRLLSLPYQHISSTHLEVRMEGWNVFVVDLNSMNGAYLRRHDEPPVRVTHVPLMLADGDIIDFGHGVSISFEGMP